MYNSLRFGQWFKAIKDELNSNICMEKKNIEKHNMWHNNSTVLFLPSSLTWLSVVHPGEEEAAGRSNDIVWISQRVSRLQDVFQLGKWDLSLAHGHEGSRHSSHLKQQQSGLIRGSLLTIKKKYQHQGCTIPGVFHWEFQYGGRNWKSAIFLVWF